MKWKCRQCGSCCKSLDKIIPTDFYNKYFYKFPYKFKDGICEMLDENNKCKVYKNRPEVCDVRACQKKFNLDDDIFNQLTIDGCKEAQRYAKQSKKTKND